MKNYRIVLASNSPRRKELLSGLGIDFEVRVLDGIDESYPSSLAAVETAEYIARKKAAAYQKTMAADELIITADTVVIVDNEVLGKPADAAEAREMLQKLSNSRYITEIGLCEYLGYKSESILTILFKETGLYREIWSAFIRYSRL